jgi:hypothetical protein
MKNLLFSILLALSITSYTNAQETEFTFNNERGMTDFVVTQVEGKTSVEIYKKAIEWIKVTYKNPDKVILSTIENEYVRFEGNSSSFYSINTFGVKTYYPTNYQIEITIKDGKYKFDLITMENLFPSSQYSSGGWKTNKFFNSNLEKEILDKTFYKKDGIPKPVFKDNIVNVPAYFK